MVDIFIAAIGTGGTFTGTAKYLKENIKGVKTYGVEPENSPLISKGYAGAHKIQGIGAGMIPGNYDASLVDIEIPITDEQALDTAREVSLTEGLLVGISSGAALAAAIDLGSRPGFENKNIVVVLPDTGERYLSTELFSTSAED